MNSINFIFLFIGCFVVTAGFHIYTMYLTESYVKKYLSSKDHGYKDIATISSFNYITLFIQFLLAILLAFVVYLINQTQY